MNSCSSTGPAVGTVLSHSVNIFVVFLYSAFAGISFFTAWLSHVVPVNTSITLYLCPLMFPSVVASKVILVYPFGTGVLGSVPVFTISFAFTVKASVFAVNEPFVNSTAFPLFAATVNDVSFAGVAVIPLSAKSAKATSFVKPWLSVNVTSSPARFSFSPSV